MQKDIYPVGRLDLDSEGLLILTNDKKLNDLLLNPKREHWRTYWLEVDGVPTKDTLDKISNGLTIRSKGELHNTKPAKIRLLKEGLKSREPDINRKKHPSTSWLEISLTEGKNRQVRKMTAAVDHPTLRLVRVGIEDLNLMPLKSGEISQISKKVLWKKLKLS